MVLFKVWCKIQVIIADDDSSLLLSGHCVLTVGTGERTGVQWRGVGLVGSHSYAVLGTERSSSSDGCTYHFSRRDGSRERAPTHDIGHRTNRMRATRTRTQYVEINLTRPVVNLPL
jgi:hypothetical protein